MDVRKLSVLSESCCHGSVPPPLGVKDWLFVLLMRLCFLSYWFCPVLSFRYGHNPSHIPKITVAFTFSCVSVTDAVRGAENLSSHSNDCNRCSEQTLLVTLMHNSCPRSLQCISAAELSFYEKYIKGTSISQALLLQIRLVTLTLDLEFNKIKCLKSQNRPTFSCWQNIVQK